MGKSSPSQQETRPEARTRKPVRWREFFRSERGEIAPHARLGGRDRVRAYPFDPEQFPTLAAAMDEWAEGRENPARRWMLSLRGKDSRSP
jgi:hypothetical protein